MSKLTRVTQNLFGSTAGPSDVAQFGSLAAGSPVFTANPATIQSLANFLTGWSGAVVGSNSPAKEDMNALFVLAFRQIAYLLQEGVAEWDSGTTYYQGSLCQDGSGNVYVSATNSNLNNPLTSATNWQKRGGLVPLGSVVATFPSLTGAYSTTATTAADQAGWVLCNGQTISDTTSPMNGQVVPNINNDVFVMGYTTAGQTGGSNTTTHTHVFEHNHQVAAAKNAGSGTQDGLWMLSASTSNPQNLTSFAAFDGNSISVMFQDNSTLIAGSGTYPRVSVTTTNNGYSAGAINCPSGSGSTATTSGPSITDNRPAFISAVYLMRIR